MNLIFFFIALSFCGIFWFGLRLPSKPHKYVLLENTLAPQHIDDLAVQTIVISYRRHLIQLIALFSVASLVFLFNLSDSIMFTLFFLHLFSLIGCGQLLLIHYIGNMRQLIVDKAWLLPIDAIRIDTKIIQEKNRKMLPLISFIPAFLLLLLGSYFSFESTDKGLSIVMVGINLLMMLLFIGLWWTIRNLPIRGMSGDSRIDQQINDATKYYWSLTLIILATGLVILTFVPLLSANAHSLWGLLISSVFVLLTIGMIIVPFILLMRLRNKQDQLLGQAKQPRYNGEDVYWRYGVYINPNDTRLFVPDRIGMNIGINLGKRSGQVLSIATLLLLIGALLFAVVPLYQLDFTPDALQGQIIDEQVIFTAPLTAKTTVSVDSIEETTLVDTIPTPIVKKIGTATEDYATGSFTVNGENAHLYVDLQAPKFLRIETKDKIIYYTNKDPEKTIALYQQLVALD